MVKVCPQANWFYYFQKLARHIMCFHPASVCLTSQYTADCDLSVLVKNVKHFFFRMLYMLASPIFLTPNKANIRLRKGNWSFRFISSINRLEKSSQQSRGRSHQVGHWVDCLLYGSPACSGGEKGCPVPLLTHCSPAIISTLTAPVAGNTNCKPYSMAKCLYCILCLLSKYKKSFCLTAFFCGTCLKSRCIRDRKSCSMFFLGFLTKKKKRKEQIRKRNQGANLQ